LSDYNADLDRLYNQYNTERDYDYSKYADDRNFAYGQFSDDRNYSYQTERDKIADAQWQAEFDEAKRQYDQQYALSASKRYSGTPTDTPDTDPEPDPDPDPIEVKMDEYVKNMLNNVLEKGVSTQWNPVAAINANKALTKEEKAVAIEIVNEYIASGAMKSQGRIE
jgi:hypothetical protein